MARTILTYASLACLFAGSLGGGYTLYVLNRHRAVGQFQEQQHRTAHVVAATLGSELAGLSRTLQAIADAAVVDARALGPLLERQLACVDAPCFVSMAAYDSAGRVRYSSGPAVGVGERDLRQLLPWALDPNGGTVQTTISSSATPSLIILTRIRRAGPPGDGQPEPAARLLAGEVAFDSIFSRERSIAERWDTSTFLVIDGGGRVLFHSSHPEMRLKNVLKRTPACLNCHATFDYVDQILERRDGVVQYTLRGVPYLASFAPLDVAGQPWIAAVMGQAEQAVGIVATQGRQFGLLMSAAVIALCAAGTVMWKDGRRRLQADADAASKAHLERSNAELTGLNARLESAALEWRATVDTIDAALIVLEPAGCIERMNRAASALLPGEPFGWLGLPSDRLAAHPPWDSALALARDAIEHDTILTSRVHRESTGRTWDLWCRTSQRLGRRDAVVIVARDVTAVVELQESLRRSETMAALGSLVAGVAHEVRNPLFAISSLVDAWSVQQNADGRKFHKALRGEVTRLKSLMNDLLEYGTPSKSRPRAHPLSSIIHEAVRSCAPEAEARRVRIVTRPRAIEADAWVDPQRFVRVLINLIQNAIQHAPPESDVTVAVSTASRDSLSRLHITVRDRGPGFREGDLPRVFTPFFSRRSGGFGLGLAICERIVVEHRGTITAANHRDGGGLVTVSLPLLLPSPADFREGAQTC